ncbi:MAG TPA: hypothetical protein VHV51_18135 [Polyangiaceae bacterium]|nr:hypothetical protein [Polyangiaceae bacterium]
MKSSFWIGIGSCLIVTLSGALSACGGSASEGAGNSSGGTTGSAGNGGSAGSISQAGNGGSACGSDSITFKLLVAPTSSTNYCVGGETYSCLLDYWLTILRADGTPLLISGGECESSCGQCEELPCSAICFEPTPIPDGGVEAEFIGAYVTSATCGAGISCLNGGCATPGNYVARMCGTAEKTAETGCSNIDRNDPPSCVDVPFSWPPATSGTVITGTIGADDETVDAGAAP